MAPFFIDTSRMIRQLHLEKAKGTVMLIWNYLKKAYKSYSGRVTIQRMLTPRSVYLILGLDSLCILVPQMIAGVQ